MAARLGVCGLESKGARITQKICRTITLEMAGVYKGGEVMNLGISLLNLVSH